MNDFLVDKDALVELVAPNGLWQDVASFEKQYNAVHSAFEDDTKGFASKADFIFQHDDIGRLTNDNVELLKLWCESSENAPSMTALGAVGVEKFGIQNEIYKKAIVNAGFLADVPSPLDYHSNMHFRKVMLQLMRMIAAHNHIHEGGELKLTEREISLLLIGGAIHDFKHDGKSNMAQGIPYPGRLEQRSFDLACRAFHAVGFAEPDDWKALNVMLLSTDVSSSADHSSYCSQMKLAYSYHFADGAVPMRLDEDIEIIKTDRRLALLSCMLHEADIATSAGIDYEVSMAESRLLAKETGIDEIATPRGLLNFFTHICNNKMLSDAGNALYAENMQKHRRLAESGVNDGNAPFPEIEDTSFNAKTACA